MAEVPCQQGYGDRMEEHVGRHLTGLSSLPLEVIVDAVAEGVIVLEGDYVVRATNFAAEQMFAPWFVLRVGEQPQAADFIDANGRKPPVEEWPFVLTMADGQPRQDVVLGIRNPTTERTGWFSISTRLAETTDASRLLVATFTDVTTAVEGARALQLRAEAEQFASSVAARFAAADADDIEAMVTEALADIARHLGADTAALWRREHGEDLLVLRRSWRRPGSPSIELPDSYSFSELVGASRGLEAPPAPPIGPEDYPEPLRTRLREGGRAAHLYLPLRPREELRGAVVVLWAETPNLRPEQIEPLSVLGDVLVSAIDVASSVIARRRSEERAAALVAHTTELVAVVEGTGRLSYANPRFVSVVGVTAGEVLRLDLVHPDDQAALVENVADALSRPDDVIAVAGRVAHPDGGWRWLEGTLTNLLLDPAVTGLVANLRDVSERIE